MAEKSKKRGEFGEDIVERLLNLIGWGTLLKGIDFNCIKPLAHTISTGGRNNHGIDFVYHCECPLFTGTQEFVLVSSKFTDKYPPSPGTKFRTYLRDLAQALECFKKSPLKNDLSIFEKPHKSYTGVIFWLDNGKENQYDDVIGRLNDFRVDNDLEFDSIYLVDNKRADFLYDTIMFAQNKFKGATEFVIPNTGHNDPVTRKTSSPILPVQYINSSILPLKVVQKKSQEILVLTVIDEFEEECLRRLISLAQQLTEGWG